MMGRLTVVLGIFFVWAMLSPNRGSAQGAGCGQCFEKAIAGLHQAPEQGPGSGQVTNPHDNWTNGRCAGFHDHDPCSVTEEEASLIVSLQRGDEVETPDLRSFLARYAERISIPGDRWGFELRACGDPQEVSFVPLPRETWEILLVGETFGTL